MPGVDHTERSSILDISSYDLALDLTGDPETFRSRTKISFRCQKPGATTFAELNSLGIRRATLNGSGLDGTLNGATTSGDSRLELPRLQNENVLIVEAEFAYATANRGLYRTDDGSTDDGSAFVYANTSRGGAPSIFCCFDQPDLRAPFTVSIRAPAGWSCLANAPVLSRPLTDEPGLWRFAPTAPIPPWLARFCAAPFHQSTAPKAPRTPKALPVTVQALPSAAARLDPLHIPELLQQSLRFYERTLVPYPYDKLDLVFGPITPDLAYSVPGLIFIQDEVLRDEAQTALYLPAVIAHELAHAWFGSLVVMPPEQRWLDEALTTYISRIALAETIPGANPWAAPVSATLPDDAYAADAAVIRQLEDLIGRPAVIAGLRTLLARHAHAQATVADLVGYWSQSSGQDLAEWTATHAARLSPCAQ